MADNVADKPVSQSPAATEEEQAPPPLALDLNIAKLTDVGRARPHNEDYVDYRFPPDARLLARKGSIFLVADGMGGHQAGEVASRGAVEGVMEYYYGDPSDDAPTSLVRAFRAANQRLYQQAQDDPSKAGMGTTLVAAVILGRKVYLANVGDSRAYLINRRSTTQITEDHSWVEEQVRAGLLTEEQAQKHPQRNLVTRALGSRPTVEVDVFEGEIDSGDRLLLCSDGLTGRVSDAEISAIVLDHAPEEAARRLVAKANEGGGNDNITVLIVSAQEERVTTRSPAIPATDERQGHKLPLVPIMAALAALILVAAGGFLARNPGIFAPDETPSLSPVPTTAVPASSATDMDVQLTATLSPTAEATSTLASMPPGASATATPSPGPETTAGQTGTATPAVTQETATPTASSTIRLPAPPLTLARPQAGTTIAQSAVTFSWTMDRPLRPDQRCQLLIWREGEEESPVHTSEPLQAESYTCDPSKCKDVFPDEGGQFFWSVRIIGRDTEAPLTKMASPRSFIYKPTGGSSSLMGSGGFHHLQPAQAARTCAPLVAFWDRSVDDSTASRARG